MFVNWISEILTSTIANEDRLHHVALHGCTYCKSLDYIRQLTHPISYLNSTLRTVQSTLQNNVLGDHMGNLLDTVLLATS